MDLKPLFAATLRQIGRNFNGNSMVNVNKIFGFAYQYIESLMRLYDDTNFKKASLSRLHESLQASLVMVLIGFITLLPFGCLSKLLFYLQLTIHSDLSGNPKDDDTQRAGWQTKRKGHDPYLPRVFLFDARFS